LGNVLLVAGAAALVLVVVALIRWFTKPVWTGHNGNCDCMACSLYWVKLDNWRHRWGVK
jgi:hypothetical protein